MLDRIYDTLRGILFYEMPQDHNGKVIIYDRPITAWYVGERDVKNTNLSVTFKGGKTNIKDIALGMQEFTHNISVEIDAGADNIDLSERLVQETTRIMLTVLRKHRRMWVIEICPICQKFTLSPEHFLITHGNPANAGDDILSSYAVLVQSDYDTLWAETHPLSIPAPTLPNSSLDFLDKVQSSFSQEEIIICSSLPKLARCVKCLLSFSGSSNFKFLINASNIDFLIISSSI